MFHGGHWKSQRIRFKKNKIFLIYKKQNIPNLLDNEIGLALECIVPQMQK